jgi:hypothetical protein
MIKKTMVFSLKVFLLVLTLSQIVLADTILFPVINVNPGNVATIVSITNYATTTSPKLKYIYRHKSITESGQPNLAGSCATYSFFNETYASDLLSFDVSAAFDNGSALFADSNSYANKFNLATSTPSRAYLLVTHADSAGNRVSVGENASLYGEVIMIDIVNGAAWGYKGVNDKLNEDYTFKSVDKSGGVYDAMSDNATQKRPVTVLPSNEWTTRLFITPVNSNMDSANNSAIVTLDTTVFGRNGSTYVITPTSKTVNCTGAFDLVDMLDSTTKALFETSGGAVKVKLSSGSALIYKLEYTTNISKYKGVINNGYLLSNYEN